MRLLRRRAPDPEADRLVRAFRTCAGRVDAAQRALLQAIPTPRDPGIPLADAVDAFLAHLADAEGAMSDWYAEPLVHEWTNCRDAIAAARSAAQALRDTAGLGFEALNARVGEVIAPLDSFADAATSMRRFGRVG